MELNEGDEFSQLEGGNFKIIKVQTHSVSDKKKIKLDNPIIHTEYVSGRKGFTTYASEVEKMVKWNRWTKIIK